MHLIGVIKDVFDNMKTCEMEKKKKSTYPDGGYPDRHLS
jgi:hypothetical protein